MCVASKRGGPGGHRREKCNADEIFCALLTGESVYSQGKNYAFDRHSTF